MPDRPLVRRRTAVLGLAATALLAGCDHGDDIGTTSGSASGSSSPSSGPATSSSSAPRTPDEAVVDEVLSKLVSATTVVSAARKAPRLHRPLDALLKAHRAHIEALDGQPPGQRTPGPPPVAAAALHQVRQSETALQAALADAAARAESGALARLLASMSASVTQYLAALPAQVAP